jgi:hypothetical protein
LITLKENIITPIYIKDLHGIVKQEIRDCTIIHIDGTSFTEEDKILISENKLLKELFNRKE